MRRPDHQVEPAVFPHEEIAPISPQEARPSGGFLPYNVALRDVF